MTSISASACQDVVDLRAAGFISSFSDRLLQSNILDEMAVGRAQRAQSQSGERFDIVLSRLGLLNEKTLVQLLADHFGFSIAVSADFPDEPMFWELVDGNFLRHNRIVPFAERNGHVCVAVCDLERTDSAHALAYRIGQPVEVFLAEEALILGAIEQLYGEAKPAAASISTGTLEIGGFDEEDVRQLADLGSEAPVIRLVNELISSACDQQASDIHIEPRDDCIVVRYRIDGVLQQVNRLTLDLRPALTSRIKIMSRLNIAEQRLPQDGRIRTTVRGRELDLRVSTMPTLRGESIVMRLLDRASVNLDLRSLGFSSEALAGLEAALNQPNGILLVTGPTGSGKTTTLYAALQKLNGPGRKLFTVEDPVEYQISGINQIQVQPKIGLNFASALRSILRQDPDIILVGEMRDLETAEVAIQASLTGHLVLSTVHTNSAAATLTRLLDMGVERYLLASSVKAILAQRLVRRLCRRCSAPLATTNPTATHLLELLEEWGRLAAGDDLLANCRVPVGCRDCRQTGYSGRTTISEVMSLDQEMQRAIANRESEASIGELACRGGMIPMFADGLQKVLCGETSLDEVLRVARV
ncbi:MAG: GspE/PulE family protein [Hyphomicrobiaceae bacterium]